MTQSERLEEAKRLLAHPDELAAEFAASVAAFAAYKNLDEHFYDSRPKHSYNPHELKRTYDVTLRLEAQRSTRRWRAPGSS